MKDSYILFLYIHIRINKYIKFIFCYFLENCQNFLFQKEICYFYRNIFKISYFYRNIFELNYFKSQNLLFVIEKICILKIILKFAIKKIKNLLLLKIFIKIFFYLLTYFEIPSFYRFFF